FLLIRVVGKPVERIVVAVTHVEVSALIDTGHGEGAATEAGKIRDDQMVGGRKAALKDGVAKIVFGGADLPLFNQGICDSSDRHARGHSHDNAAAECKDCDAGDDAESATDSEVAKHLTDLGTQT